jgi:hypothetical protein
MCIAYRSSLLLIVNTVCGDDILYSSFPKIFQPFPVAKEINAYITAKLSHENAVFSQQSTAQNHLASKAFF